MNEVNKVSEYHENSDDDANKIKKSPKRLRNRKESVDERVQKTRRRENPKERVAQSWIRQRVDVRQRHQQKYGDVLKIVQMRPADVNFT